MNTIKNLLLLAFAGILMVGCGKTSFKKTAGGMPYKLFPGKDTQRVTAGSFMKVHLTQTIKDSVYFSSTEGMPIYIPITEATQPYDLSELWTSLKVGDSIVATQMMDTFIKRSPQNIPPQFKKGDKIITNIRVLAVFATDSAKNADEEKGKKEWLVTEIKTIEKYLAEKKISAQKTTSGAYVEIINPGTGNLIDSGKYISVKYSGTSWSGKKFDSNTDSAFGHMEPLSFVVGTPGGMIKGFDEGVKLMKLGGKAKVYIPSMLAYAGSPNSPLIKPYENLIFEIEILNVQDKAPAP